MVRLDKLWHSVGGPGRPPHLNIRRVKARVNAALDARPTERKIYMRQKWRAALATVAAVAAITGTAFAATANWDMLTAWFQGDTAPGQEYVDSTVRSVSDKNYTLTVESSAMDELSAYMTVTITALSDEAKEFLHAEEFNSIDTFEIQIPAVSAASEEPPDTPDSAIDKMILSYSYHDLDAPGENSRRFAIAVDNVPASAETLLVRCGYMEKGKAVEVSVVPAKLLTVKIDASGAGVLDYSPAEIVGDTSMTIQEITLSPFTCHVYGKCFAANDVCPNLRFRMTNGTVLTQAQMMKGTSRHFNGYTGQFEYHYRFEQVQDLESISSVIVFDMEYPLDGSAPAPAEHDPALDPFTVTRMEPLVEGSGYTIPVRELTEKLGGTYSWNATEQSVSCTYRGVTVALKPGSATALVDNQEIEMRYAPMEQDGILTSDVQLFQDAWGIDCRVQRENGNHLDDTHLEVIWHDWYIVP